MQPPIPPYPSKHRRENGAPSRWDQYVDLLARKRVPDEARRWYVARVEGFLKELRPESLKELTKEQITGYFQEASTTGNLVDWQFRQLVDAIQLLVDLAQVPVGREIDWHYWREAGKPLDTVTPEDVQRFLTHAVGNKERGSAKPSNPSFPPAATRQEPDNQVPTLAHDSWTNGSPPATQWRIRFAH